MSKLKDKVAIVTGASKGIGASIALHLAAEGAAVVVNYASSREGADRVVQEIVAQGGRAIAVQADAGNAADLDRLFEEAQTAFGRPHIVVNNAGIFGFAPLEEITEEHFHSHFNLNVLGVILASQRAVRAFGDEGGVIINISSRAAVNPGPHASVYSATKAAVDAITRSLSKELGPRKIRVNAINPGLIQTEGVQSSEFLGQEFQQAALSATPLGRNGLPEDVAKAAVFLACDDSAWITGQTLLVTGGRV